MQKLGIIKKKKTKFILSFFSGIFYSLGQGALFGSGGLSVYILSYIHHKDKWVDIQYGNLMTPVILLFRSLFSPLSDPLEKLWGPIISLLISSIIVEICLFLFYFQRNIWIFYSITLLSGFGVGTSANITIKNACSYYPEKKGLINACIISIIGISTALYALVGEALINPNKEGVIDENTDPYYSEEVSQNVKKYFIFAIIVLPIGTVLSILFFYKYDSNCENEEKEKDEENEEIKEIEEKKELKDAFINKKEQDKDLNSFNKQAKGKNIKKALKSFRFWRNILIASIMPFWIFLIHSSFRPYVVMLGVDTNIIFFLGSGLTIIGYLVGPVWAFLVDKFGFQPIMKIIGFLCLSMSVYFYFFIGNKLFYPIGLIFTVSSTVGIMSALIPHLMHVFGMRYFLTIGGFAKLFNELSGFIAALTSIIFSVFFKNASDLLFPYRITISIGGIICILGLILFFLKMMKNLFMKMKMKKKTILK